LNVNITNSGASPITSAILEWSINGTSQGTIPYAGTLNTWQTATLELGVMNYNLSGNMVVKVWITDINGLGIDNYQGDDTITQTIDVCGGGYSGVFNIGPTSAYRTVQDVYDLIDRCGINGDVTFAFETGTYSTALDFTGNTARFGGYKLTVTSQAGDRNAVKFEPVATSVVTLNNSSNITLEHLTFGRYTTNHTYAVNLSGPCANIAIRNCNLLCDTVTTSTYSPLYKASGFIVDTFSLTNCLLDGGYYGAYFYGGANIIGALNTHAVFDSNTFRNNYYYGIVASNSYFKSISHNTVISRMANNTAYCYGIYLTSSHAEDIIGNRIRQRYSTGTTYTYYYGGIQLSSVNTIAIPGRRSLKIINNEIITSATAATASYGLYLTTVGLAGNPTT
jgi:hypothetical protein